MCLLIDKLVIFFIGLIERCFKKNYEIELIKEQRFMRLN